MTQTAPFAKRTRTIRVKVINRDEVPAWYGLEPKDLKCWKTGAIIDVWEEHFSKRWMVPVDGQGNPISLAEAPRKVHGASVTETLATPLALGAVDTESLVKELTARGGLPGQTVMPDRARRVTADPGPAPVPAAPAPLPPDATRLTSEELMEELAKRGIMAGNVAAPVKTDEKPPVGGAPQETGKDSGRTEETPPAGSGAGKPSGGKKPGGGKKPSGGKDK